MAANITEDGYPGLDFAFGESSRAEGGSGNTADDVGKGQEEDREESQECSLKIHVD